MEYQGQRYAFDVLATLGRGGMGEVYLAARRDDPSVQLAIKIPAPHLPPDVQQVFLREAAAAQEVASPYVVRVVDWGDAPPCIAFEYVSSGTLAKEIHTRWGNQDHWSNAELISHYRELVLAMIAINSKVIHRDLKPDNVFYDTNGILIGDFGLSKYVNEVTRTNTFKGGGTPAYMAPETFRFESADWRSDQYSLGVMFFEMATLERPFVGNPHELERQHLYDRPKRVTARFPGLPERLASLIARMLEKRPDDRFQSWQNILDELDELDSAASGNTQGASDDPIVQMAARQVEKVRSEDLERQRAEDERQQLETQRRHLLTCWANRLYDIIDDQIAQINRALGAGTIKIDRFFTLPQGHVFSAIFLKARLRIALHTIPVQVSESAIAWGVVEVRTGGRSWYSNALLLAQPPPYGTWYNVDMEVSPLIARRDHVPSDNAGGAYRVENRIVLAQNPQALLYQRRGQNVMSDVQYTERELSPESFFSDLLQIFVNDATV